MKKIVILTGSELRHTFFRKFMALADIQVLASYCEGLENSVHAVVEAEKENEERRRHLQAREQSEKEFFEPFIASMLDQSNPKFIPRGAINQAAISDEIIKLNPDFLVAYGCSLIHENLINKFKGRFLNVHLGLSPYYRGSGTNYWALVNNEPEAMGATFMYIDPGVDTGEIIHQIRARALSGDTPHMFGNRLITDMAHAYKEIVLKFDTLKKLPQPAKPKDEKVYRRKDFSEESVKKLRQEFSNGLVEKYLKNAEQRNRRFPLIRQPGIEP